jgi:hypothetical protein
MRKIHSPLSVSIKVLAALTIIILSSCTKEELNKVPVVNAGPDQVIQLPTGTFGLIGTAADSDGDVVAYLWSQLQGPSNTQIVNEANATTEVMGFVQGHYIFQLMATDDEGATGVDTVSIHVLPGQPITQTISVIDANDAVLADWGGSDNSNLVPPDWHISHWTKSSISYVSRAAFKFDLSAIPANATIESAELFLYSYPSPTLTGNFVDANFGSVNGLYLQRIVDSWTETGLNWAGQPSVTTTGQIAIPATTQSQQDLTLDVKDMVTKMISEQNNGFMLRLQNENTVYNIRIFVSPSNTAHVSKRPKLVVTYR